MSPQERTKPIADAVEAAIKDAVAAALQEAAQAANWAMISLKFGPADRKRITNAIWGKKARKSSGGPETRKSE